MTEVFYYDTTTINDQEYFLAATSLGIAYLGLKSQDNSTPIFGFYPNKMLIHDPKRLEPYVKELKEYFAGKRRKFNVPIDISEFGTAFQRSVLEVVKKVPYGTTVSYGDIATSLENARSVRAVAHAVALNPVLIFISCHRIIMSNGKPGGYRLGPKEKIRLINLEKSYLREYS